jgi:hypothetical protein
LRKPGPSKFDPHQIKKAVLSARPFFVSNDVTVA